LQIDQSIKAHAKDNTESITKTFGTKDESTAFLGEDRFGFERGRDATGILKAINERSIKPNREI